ncbi:MAG: DNA translocase FtsK 4TM domain-containing protein [Desulfosporosinus sp.]|nr:DNA translocase FtsK 4TM domain-containing protein [Desulfosporosinus sp.]
MARAKKRRTVNKRVNMQVSTLKDTIRNEVIGVFIVGMACLGLVTIFADKSGVIGGQIKHILTVLAGSGRVSIPILVGAWGLAFMNKQTPRLGFKAAGVILLWLVFVGILHLQLAGIEAFSTAEMIDEGMVGHGGGLIGAGIAILLKTTIGIPGSYVVLTMAAFMGALLITNRSLVQGVQEVGQVGKESGQWMKHQMGDFIDVLKNSDAEESQDKGSGTQADLKAEAKMQMKKSVSAKGNSRALDPDVVERPLVIKTLEDHNELSDETQALQVPPKDS